MPDEKVLLEAADLFLDRPDLRDQEPERSSCQRR